MTMEDQTTPITLGGEVTYLVLLNQGGELVRSGEFPHCRMHRVGDKRPQCKATIKITDHEGTTTERCTREKRHGLPHVKHLAPGVPLIAWRPEQTTRSDR